jgi:potassium-transporting ATPase KdpC subunit
MKDLITSALMITVLTAALGFGYPFAVWAIGQTLFPHQANGSLIKNERGETVGSELIGQNISARVRRLPETVTTRARPAVRISVRLPPN